MPGEKILIVDDEQDIVSALSIRLKAMGYEVDTAFDGMEALDKARAGKPDLILLDIMLPKLDGYKVCRMLKFDEQYKDIPIIMLTAKVSDQNRKMGQEMGANGYLNKPFNPEELMSTIRKLLEERRK
ncbi:MAG: response regulator [Candidatus Margulisiibacteriota bacterium]|nr:response regulator [Candidatus Margulisiibacteriota bacterium]